MTLADVEQDVIKNMVGVLVWVFGSVYAYLDGTYFNLRDAVERFSIQIFKRLPVH